MQYFVPKKDRRARIGVNYKDLNRAIPMMTSCLPHINMLIESVACHAMYSFIAFSSNFHLWSLNLSHDSLQSLNFNLF